MSIPKCMQNRNLRPLHINGVGLCTVERVGDQHYVIWRDGVPLTEVQCIPTESRQWYFRGSGLKWNITRNAAIAEGIKAFKIGRGISGRPLPVWSIEADAAIKSTKNGD